MVLLFRFIGALIKGAFQARIGPFEETLVHMRVWPNDLDLNLHASSGRYVSFMDAARVAMLVRFGAFRKVIARGWRPVVGGTLITFRRSLYLFERMTIRSRMVCWDEKWFYMEHTIEKADGQLAAKARVRVTFKDYGFFVPLDSAGSKAKVEGTVKVAVLAPEKAKHYESEGAVVPRGKDGKPREVQLVASGVELRK